MSLLGQLGPPRRAPTLAAVPLLLAALLAPAVAAADPPSSAELRNELEDAGEHREELERERAGAAGDVEAAQVELARIDARLADAGARLRLAEGQAALATTALEEAETERADGAEAHEDAAHLLAALEEELEAEAAVLEEQVVQTFKYGSSGARHGELIVEAIHGVNDPSAFAAVLRDLQVIVERQDETVDTVAGLRRERDHQAEDTARTRGIAMQTSLDAATTLEVVEALRDVAAEVAEEIEVEVRRERELLGSLELTESEAAQLVERASAREKELEEQLEGTRERERREEEQRRAEEAARQRAEEAARQRAEEAQRRAEEAAQREVDEAAQREADEAAQREADEAAQREADEAAQREADEAAQKGTADTASRRDAVQGAAAAGAAGGPSIEGMVCPVAGVVAGRDFSNDWGYPRSGGRTHQGNDIFADRGTQVVAIGAGEVVRTTPANAPTRLGGITVTYETADGSQWYNAHLDAIAAGIEVGARVQRGQAIGTVGNTGNARPTPPHLHLGRHVGGRWVNPWPTVSGACR